MRTSTINNRLNEHIKVVKTFVSDELQIKKVSKAVDLCGLALKNGNRLLFCGNGGSASDCQHIATELTIRYKEDRPAIGAIALTTDTSAITAAGNDLGFDRIFSRQVEALGTEGDILIAISTSGNSQNVIMAVQEAKAKKMPVIFLGGRNGGKLKDMADISLIVPSDVTAHIQEVHIMIGHILCEGIENALGFTSV